MSLEVVLSLHFFSFLKNSITWFSPRSLSYFVSSSWSSKQCWVWVPSCGMGLKSNQLLVGYFHKLCHLACRTLLRVCDWFDVCVSLLITWRISSSNKDIGRWEWRLYVGTSSTSPWSVRGVDVVFSKRCCQFVKSNLYLVLANNSLGYLGIPVGPFWLTTQLDNP